VDRGDPALRHDGRPVAAARPGRGLGGLILLAFATNLPELAINVTAAISRNFGIAIGNILGGIAIQTVVLVLLDGLGVRRAPLTYRAASLVLAIEGALVIALLVVVIMGTRLSKGLIFGARVTPAELTIVALWLAGLWLIGRARTHLPWHASTNPPDGQEEPRGVAEAKKNAAATERKHSTARIATVFAAAAAAAATLGGGVVLRRAATRSQGTSG
jgi:cation:H+ antiporter